MIEQVIATRRLMQAAVRCLAADLNDHDHAHSDEETAYAYELLALAARDLTRAIDQEPPETQPVGWAEK